jgi:hypothetical protein
MQFQHTYYPERYRRSVAASTKSTVAGLNSTIPGSALVVTPFSDRLDIEPIVQFGAPWPRARRAGERRSRLWAVAPGSLRAPAAATPHRPCRVR